MKKKSEETLGKEMPKPRILRHSNMKSPLQAQDHSAAQDAHYLDLADVALKPKNERKAAHHILPPDKPIIG